MSEQTFSQECRQMLLFSGGWREENAKLSTRCCFLQVT